MTENSSQMDKNEKLKAENDYLKMKLMLEQGAQFGASGNPDPLPPEMENIFLNNVIAFEREFAKNKTIRLFDKIGRPAHFRPVHEIPDEDIARAWMDLREYLFNHEIVLDACSPNVTERELYRFATEELFNQEIDDMNLPGWTTNFIYDEFYPDPVYDNTRTAINSCINYILQKEPLEWTQNFTRDNLRLNGHSPLTVEELKTLTSRFKNCYDEIDIKEIGSSDCTVDGKECQVTGSYSITATYDKTICPLSGEWKVRFRFNDEMGYWYITEVDIEGIEF